jgi:hypothetical protein
MKSKLFSVLIIIIFLQISCKSNDDLIEEKEEVVLTEQIKIYDKDKLEKSLVFGINNGGKSAFLINKEGQLLKEWKFDRFLGNDLIILPNGKLLGIFKADNLSFSFGGFGGVIRIINTDGTIDWEFNYHSDNYLAHHDIEMLPNGNILIMVWERINNIKAQQMGVNVTNDLFTEALIEVNPSNNEIVWEWHSIDHLVQDIDSSLPNFGVVKDSPQLINHNYALREDGDIFHANGIDYDPVKDVIYISVNFYSEVWVIDHSTNSEESKSHSGGNYNKGGDLIYRFGNPETYNNNIGKRLFYNNHFPNYLQNDEIGAGNILIFNNNFNTEQSIVHELKMPAQFKLTPDFDNEPIEVWNFTSPDLYNMRISGAVRLKNGSTLICEGDYGFWEVTTEKEVVWKFNDVGNFWRAYSYLETDPEIINLKL